MLFCNNIHYDSFKCFDIDNKMTKMTFRQFLNTISAKPNIFSKNININKFKPSNL